MTFSFTKHPGIWASISHYLGLFFRYGLMNKYFLSKVLWNFNPLRIIFVIRFLTCDWVLHLYAGLSLILIVDDNDFFKFDFIWGLQRSHFLAGRSKRCFEFLEWLIWKYFSISVRYYDTPGQKVHVWTDLGNVCSALKPLVFCNLSLRVAIEVFQCLGQIESSPLNQTFAFYCIDMQPLLLISGPGINGTVTQSYPAYLYGCGSRSIPALYCFTCWSVTVYLTNRDFLHLLWKNSKNRFGIFITAESSLILKSWRNSRNRKTPFDSKKMRFRTTWRRQWLANQRVSLRH